MRNQKQTKLGHLLSEQDRFDERRLAASFVAMAGPLPCRPEPRHLFDNAASPGRTSYRGLPVIIAARAVMQAAITSGDMPTIEKCARRVHEHFADAEAIALRPYHAIVSGQVSLAEARERASKETTEALHAIVTSTVRHDDGSEAAIKELDEAIEALANLRMRMLIAQRPSNDQPRLARA